MLEERPKPIKRSTRIWLITLAVAGIGAGILWSLRPHPLLLLSRAKRIADTRYWRKDPGAYFWLSNHEIMLFRTWPKDPYEAIRLDLRTMQETPMTPLNKALKAELGTNWGDGLELLPSPDGNHLLCISPGSIYRLSYAIVPQPGTGINSPIKPYVRKTFTVDIDGTHLVHGQRKAGGDRISNYKWRCDSKGYIAPLNGDRHRFDSIQIFGLDTQVAKNDVALGDYGEIPINAGLTAENSIVGTDAGNLFGSGSTAKLKSYPLKAGAKPAQKLVPLPTFADYYNTIVSPNGDRIAWVISGTGRKSHTNLLEKFFSFLGQKPVPTAGLWVSKVDGSELHEIGRMEFPWKPKGNNLPSAALRLSMVRWTPDSKHLSFIHDEALYTVPVD
jgi:hypothetical protein